MDVVARYFRLGMLEFLNWSLVFLPCYAYLVGKNSRGCASDHW